MVAPNTVKAGDTLYDVHRERMGNTRMSRLGCWPVFIVEVYPDGSALARWNGNAPRKYCPMQLKRLRRSKPKAKP